MAALTLERLRLLHAVAARGSIAAAARDAGFTASAVSQQLSALERELGAALLERSNRGASLTPAGLRLSERAAAILDLADAAAAEVRHGATGADPVPLRLGAFPTAITSIVVPAMAALGPRIALTVVHLEPEQALVELVERRLDAAVVDAYDDQPGPEHAGLRVVDLLADRLRVAVSGDVRPRDVRDLAALPWILAGPRARLGRSARAALRAAGLPAPSVLLETDEHALAYAVMRDVAAATVQPELALRGAPRHVQGSAGSTSAATAASASSPARCATRTRRRPRSSRPSRPRRGSCARRDVAGRYIGGRSQPRRAERLPSPRWTRSARER